MGMTNEEREIALYCLKANSDYHSEVCEECVKYPNCDHMIQDDVTETIIKALEQQPCEDCISRKDVIILIDEATELHPYKVIGDSETYSNYNQGWEDACNWLYANVEGDNLKTVTPQPKVGKWIDYYKEMPIFNAGGFTETKHVGWTCSCCGENNIWIKSDYCPHCGSFNGGEEDGEN